MNNNSWQHLEDADRDLAETGRRLFYQGSEIASAFLATTAPDGGPRVHPVFPVLALGELWLFVVNLSPKYRDLVRNGKFALHTMPTQFGGEEFYLRGQGEIINDADVKAQVVAATGGRQGSQEFEALVRCELSSVLYTRWDNWGTEEAWPNYIKWRP